MSDKPTSVTRADNPPSGRLPLALAILFAVLALAAGSLALWLHGQISQRDSQIERASEDNRILAAQIESLRQQIASLEGELKMKSSEIDQKAGELENLSRDLTETKSRMLEIAQEKEKLAEAMKSLRSDLKNQIASRDVSVTESGGNVIIKLTDRILFDSGKLDLKPEAQTVLSKIALALGKFPDRLARIEGHTDNVPVSDRLKERFPSNWELSTARAAAAVRHLIDKGGVSADRLQAIGYADTRPLAPNDSEANRALNRRIEIVLVPKNNPEEAASAPAKKSSP